MPSPPHAFTAPCLCRPSLFPLTPPPHYSGLSDGETICDPLCGGGGIPIEAAYEWPQSLVLAGDSHEQAFQRTLDNIAYNDEKRGYMERDALCFHDI